KRREIGVDEWYTATNKDSFAMVKELTKKENILVGPSSGSVMSAMLEARDKIENGIIVGIFADDGRKFKSLYQEQNVLNEEEYGKDLQNAKFLSKLFY
ncbi:MAG: cysteine synthase family protein, partial [Nitrososphaeraceae archaeon]|nr:cysteine synthase family protein [Nitrososphaeraceae archaeon]